MANHPLSYKEKGDQRHKVLIALLLIPLASAHPHLQPSVISSGMDS